MPDPVDLPELRRLAANVLGWEDAGRPFGSLSPLLRFQNALTPDVVLALLDRIDRIDALEAAAQRWRPDWGVCPGDILQEVLAERGMTQTVLAELLGYSLKHVNQVCQGHVRITAETALRLEEVLSVSAEFWLRLQAVWDLHQLRADPGAVAGQPESEETT